MTVTIKNPIAFVCAHYDIETGDLIESFDWTCSANEMVALFSVKELATLVRGEFVEIEEERLNVTTRYAIKEGTKT